MTTSSARKAAAAKKASGTYRKIARRKTARKVGAGKAHSRGRKTASKVVAEKARGTYRKTAAQFKEFAYDAKCQSRCALSPRRAYLRRVSFMCTLSKLY